jgi:hypothetical protein
MSNYRTPDAVGNVMENRSDRNTLWPAVLGGGLVGASGAAGAGIARLIDPFKEYKGTLESVELIDPKKLRKIRLGALQKTHELTKKFAPELGVQMREILEAYKAGQLIDPELIRSIDATIHTSGLIPALRKSRMLAGGAIGLGAGLGGLGVAALIKKLRGRKSNSVGRVVPPSA